LYAKWTDFVDFPEDFCHFFFALLPNHAFHARCLIRFCEIDHAVFEDLIHGGYHFLRVFEQLGV